ncbi:hypothetical protein [Nostoc sp. FACHB-133]|nr:hypothetical protein [Nostoc sp. FACHB-133]
MAAPPDSALISHPVPFECLPAAPALSLSEPDTGRCEGVLPALRVP